MQAVLLPVLILKELPTQYTYRGDRLTAHLYKGAPCEAIKVNGKCIRGRNGNMLVSFQGKAVVVLARQLRKIKS